MFKVFHSKYLDPLDNTMSKWLTIDTNVTTSTSLNNTNEKRPYILGYADFQENHLSSNFIHTLGDKVGTWLHTSEIMRNLTLVEYLALAQAIKKQKNTFNKKLNKFVKP